MSSGKAFFAILCLLALPLFGHAEKKTNDSRLSKNDDSRSSDDSSETRPKPPETLGGKTLKEWISDLTHRDPSVRAAAIAVLPGFGEAASIAVEPLIKHSLIDHDNSPRVKAAIALRMMYIPKTQRGAVIKALGRCIVDPNSQAIVRYEAITTMMRFGHLKEDERGVIPDLVANLGSTATWEVRHICIIALITAGVDEKKGPDPRVTDALILRAQQYYEPADQVRLEAIMALGAMGRPQDPKMLAKVVTILKAGINFRSPNRSIRMWSHVALMALEDKVYEKELLAIADNLKDKEAAVRVQAVAALGALEDKAHAYVSNLCDLLKKEKDPSVKAAAAAALGHMGNKGDRVINALVDMTEDTKPDSFDMVLGACNALAHLGANTPDVNKAMEKVLEHQSLRPYQKDLVKAAIDELKTPKKKPLKDPPKSPERGIKAGVGQTR
jgi:HEAT repeat protein